MIDNYTTTGAEPAVNLRPEFRKSCGHLDAPQFLPRGASDDGMTIAMVARSEDVWDIFDL